VLEGLRARTAGVFVATAAAFVAPSATGQAAETPVAPHRAIYDLSLAAARSGSGIVGVQGLMVFQWGESCEGWAVEHRYRIRIQRAEDGDSEIVSNHASFESKDGLTFDFTVRKRNDDAEEEIRGAAVLDGPGLGGTATLTRPETLAFPLPPGTVFPTAHTLELLASAARGERFVLRTVFDGSEVEPPSDVNAVIGPPRPPAEGAKAPLDRPGWAVRLAFFEPGATADRPNVEISMTLLDNGIVNGMTIDYGDFAVRAALRQVDPIAAPRC